MNTDSGTTRREARIAELDRIIQTEEAKPDPDYQLIDDCIREIGELEGAKVDFSKEEVAEATKKILRKAEREKRRKRIVRYAAAAAAVVVLVGGVTACTVNPALVDWIIGIAHRSMGSIMRADEVTYINQGVTKKYNSVEDFIADNELDVFYPTALPDQTRIQYVELVELENYKVLSFDYSDNKLQYNIEFHKISGSISDNIISEIESNELVFRVYKNNEAFTAVSEYNGVSYIIGASNLDDIILIIGGLTKN